MELTQEQIETKRKEIQKGNDYLRGTFFGLVTFTRGLRAHPMRDEVLTMVREFSDFNPENDPHQEHDFGTVELESEQGSLCEKRQIRYEKFFWKIDYYDENLSFGADPYTEPFRRVLTIMTASEY